MDIAIFSPRPPLALRNSANFAVSDSSSTYTINRPEAQPLLGFSRSRQELVPGVAAFHGGGRGMRLPRNGRNSLPYAFKLCICTAATGNLDSKHASGVMGEVIPKLKPCLLGLGTKSMQQLLVAKAFLSVTLVGWQSLTPTMGRTSQYIQLIRLASR